MIQNYTSNFDDIDNLSNLFHLMFTQKPDFDRKKFQLSQQLSYPRQYLKAKEGKSLKFTLEDEILKYKEGNSKKIVLPPQIVSAIFINLHQKARVYTP